MFHELSFLFTCDNRNRGILRLNFDEAACLWQCVLATKGSILEIGRRHGGSTVLLLHASGLRKVISVDVAPDHAEAAERYFVLPEVRERLQLVVGNSHTFISPPVGLLFIDGDHSYEGCAADVLAHWGQLMQADEKTPALAVFHDAVPNDGLAYANAINHCPGVTQVCDKLVASGCASIVQKSGSMLVLQKQYSLPDNLFEENKS